MPASFGFTASAVIGVLIQVRVFVQAGRPHHKVLECP